ncbi:serine/threonine-protein kinase 4-like [Rhineura floridana]|uniref:serine/threonine-protein kinase 4-like n=1 Tax=Rhineura floridana TaxID=261503 RepID=UPI002AC7FB27|nr:serine/threonine-protein kinase 4-like [Rhineura floridana]
MGLTYVLDSIAEWICPQGKLKKPPENRGGGKELQQALLENNCIVADFGVAGQLTDTMAKRNTVIGTLFWMAPEVIQEIGYNCLADIWSLGITAIEMAEGKPPYADIHPMRAIFIIPTNPPPTFRKPELWSDESTDFVKQCLVKCPEKRATATQLLQNPFVKSAKGVFILQDLINEAMDIKLKIQEAQQRELYHDDEENSEENETDYRTMVWAQGQETGTIRAACGMSDGINTMIEYDDTLEQPFPTSAALESQLGTMVINAEDEEDEGTMKSGLSLGEMALRSTSASLERRDMLSRLCFISSHTRGVTTTQCTTTWNTSWLATPAIDPNQTSKLKVAT